MVNRRITDLNKPTISQIFHDNKPIIYTIITVGLFLLLISQCDPISIIAPRQWNYAVVDYHDGKIIFYLSSRKSMSTLPDRRSGFMVLKYNRNESMYQSAWVIVSDQKCNNNEKANNIAKLVYGDTPKCYRTLVKDNNIILNEKYKVRGYVPNRKYEYVTFRLVKCNNKKGICLETNSPVSLLGEL